MAAVLNGEKKKLRMERGTSQQVDCLTNADAYVPAENSNMDLSTLLQSQVSAFSVAVMSSNSIQLSHKLYFDLVKFVFFKN